MSDFNKSYRVRTEVGKDTHLNVKLDRSYDILEVMSLKINQKNAYRFHTSNYGVIAGRVLANGALGIPNAKVSVFINIDDTDINDVVKTILYPYNTTKDKNGDGTRYNLLPNEKVNDCHSVIGTFPEKQYMLDNDCVLEIFEKYYKFTTKTNNAGDYMIFGVPTGNQTIHVDLDLSDIGILSQKPRDMIYKGYDVNQFENANKFKTDTNLDSLTQVISQDSVTNVIPFWGEESEEMIGITRCDISIQYKFEPTCVFLGSIISDTSSNGISKKCIPSADMGAMDEMVAGMGTIEMIRKTPDGNVEEFQIQGTQLINGDGVWCYQIPMNLDYVMTDEYGNMVPTNDPNKGIPTRTKVRFRVSMQDFENDNANIFRCKMLVPNNPETTDIDYQFGTATKEESFKDLFWNGVYSVKSYIPRIQKGSNWKNSKFTGFKRVNYHGDKNPLPYNNIRIRIPFMFTIICALIKTFFTVVKFVNAFSKTLHDTITSKRSNSTFTVIDGTLCSEELDNVCIIPGINIQKIVNNADNHKITAGILARTLELFVMNYTGKDTRFEDDDEITQVAGGDTKSIDLSNNVNSNYDTGVKATYGSDNKSVTITGVRVTDSLDYVIQCIEMNLAQEYRVVQFDFYNDWINGLIYIPRWMRNISKKRTFLWGLISVGGKVKACNANFSGGKRNIVQQCGLSYKISNNEHSIQNKVGCDDKTLMCHKSVKVRKKIEVLTSGGIVHDVQTLKGQYVYYFKPIDTHNDKIVKLFATDIILLGTLNECDRWGIPNSLNELQSSTYQMPSNLALTDSDIDGYTYDNDESKISFKYKKEQDTSKEGKEANVKIDEFEIGHKALVLREDDGNYTEVAGIDWGYTGPLQMKGIDSDEKEDLKLYKPGGHFLGLSCRNSQTTIKTCINLSRICEHGVWMSQRQQLLVPGTSENNFIEIATVPTGVIAKDEISDTSYRWHFATMNHNRLKTTTDNKTGYPIYDFIGVMPIGFGGELEKHTNGKTTKEYYENEYFNRFITGSVTEHYFNYDGNQSYKYADYYNRSQESSKLVSEKQITRTGEWMDNEYWRFRLGLKETDNNKISEEKKKHYLLSETGQYSFPMYENSFYFYFGVKNGATALDEFKKDYYAVCETNNDLVQVDRSIDITNLKIDYDGICGYGTGKASFNVKASEETFGTNGIKVTVYNSENNTDSIIETSVTYNNPQIICSNLKEGLYNIILESENGVKVDKEFYISKISVTANVNGVNFVKDVSNMTQNDIFILDRSGNTPSGGYIEISNNMLSYKKGTTDDSDETEDNSNVFNSSGYIDHISIEDEINNIVVSNNRNAPMEFSFNGNTVVITNNVDSGNYMIPVPKADVKYNVYLHTYMDDNGCKLEIDKYNSSIHKWLVGTVEIQNAQPLNFTFNAVSHRSYLNGLTNNGSVENTEGWWSEKSGVLSTQPELIQWRLKSILYKDNIESTSKVNIINTGGVAPYTDIIGGMKEDFSTITGLTRADIEAIKYPTINYSKGGKRRNNFSYQVQDANGQIYPASPFVFPIIYKPFFMEMGLWYFDETKQYFLHGNVYNGKTWDYRNEGFNECKLNGMVISNIGSINKPDETMEIDEPGISDKGGYGYVGDYNKYNARKVNINREIEPITYGLYTDSGISKFNFSIGTNKTSSDGTSFKDVATISRNDIRLYTFALTGKAETNTYYVWMKLNNPGANYETYLIANDATNGYTYPLVNGKLSNSDSLKELTWDLMNHTIKSSTFNNGMVKDGMIDLSKANGTVYYIAVNKNNENEPASKSNEHSKLKGVSISSLINLDSLSKFYPLEISIETTYVKNGDNDYELEAKISATGDTKSQENFKNKMYTFTFYKNEQDGGQTVLQTITRSIGNSSNFILDLRGYRTALGLTDASGFVDYYFEVTDNSTSTKGPARYDVGKAMAFNFIDASKESNEEENDTNNGEA